MDKDQELLNNRSKNLKKILVHDYESKKDKMAEKIGVQKDTLIKYLNPLSKKPCHYNAARRIEKIMKLAPEYLDKNHNEELETYIISIKIDPGDSYQISKTLMDYDYIKECHYLIGTHDFILKALVPNYRILDLLISEISKIPGFKSSSSQPVIESLSWQRSQIENMKISQREAHLTPRNGFEDLRYRKRNYHYNAIKELDSGSITVKKSDSVYLHSKEIILGTKKTLHSTRYLGMKVASQVEYIEKERDLINDEGIISKRIIVLPNEISEKDLILIKKENEEYENIGCLVRFVNNSDWRPTDDSDTPEYFIVVDNSYLAVRRETRKTLLVKNSSRKINEYLSAFDANWKIGLQFSDIEDIIKSNNPRRMQFFGKKQKNKKTSK